MSSPDLEIGEEIYEGTFRGTYNGDRVIIKKYDKGKMKSEDIKHMEWEATALKNLNTRYVIHRIDEKDIKEKIKENGVEVEKDYRCVIVEDISETLRYYLENFRNRQSIVKETAVHRFLVNILSGLRELHKKKKYGDNEGILMHRNINPDTVFLSNGGEFILGDLGLIKNIPVLDASSVDIQSAQTVFGQQCDSDEVTYLAPETITPNYDSKADIWSVGCLLYEMCTLEPAFTMKDLMNGRNNLQNRINELRLPTEYSDELDKIMRDMLCYDSKQRKSSDKLLAEYTYLHDDSEISIKSDNDFEELLVYNGDDREEEKVIPPCPTSPMKPNNREMTVVEKIYENEMLSPNRLSIDDMMKQDKYESASIKDRIWFFPIDKSLYGEPYFTSEEEIISFKNNTYYYQKYGSLVLNAIKRLGYSYKDDKFKPDGNHFLLIKNVIQSKEETEFVKRLIISMKLLHFNLFVSFYEKLIHEATLEPTKRKWFLDNFKDILKDDEFYKHEYEEMKKILRI